MRRRIPLAITFRRPRASDEATTPRPAKRAPITALWDEMVSAAPVDVATADIATAPSEPPAWAGWAVSDDAVDEPRAWTGWAVADDADEHQDGATELVIRHVHGRTGPALAVPFVQFAAAQPRTRVPSGIYVIPLSTEIEQLADMPDDSLWDEPAAPTPAPALTSAPRRSPTGITTRGWRWNQAHVAVTTLVVLLVIAAWRQSPTTQAADAVAPALAPSDATPAPFADAELPARTLATSDVPTVAGAQPRLTATEPPPDAASRTVAARDEPDEPKAPPAARPGAGFDYRAARRYIDEQASYLRETCMQKGPHPRERLRIEVAVQPGGVAHIAVPGVSAEVRGCVRRVLTFPFDPSPRGADLVYTLTATRSHLRPRDDTPTD